MKDPKFKRGIKVRNMYDESEFIVGDTMWCESKQEWAYSLPDVLNWYFDFESDLEEVTHETT